MAALVSAQSISDIPACALPCIKDGVAKTDCKDTDLGCICKAENFKIQGAATSCVLSKCGADKAVSKFDVLVLPTKA